MNSTSKPLPIVAEQEISPPPDLEWCSTCRSLKLSAGFCEGDERCENCRRAGRPESDQCSVCDEQKPVGEFPPSRGVARPVCRLCRREESREKRTRLKGFRAKQAEEAERDASVVRDYFVSGIETWCRKAAQALPRKADQRALAAKLRELAAGIDGRGLGGDGQPRCQ